MKKATVKSDLMLVNNASNYHLSYPRHGKYRSEQKWHPNPVGIPVHLTVLAHLTVHFGVRCIPPFGSLSPHYVPLLKNP